MIRRATDADLPNVRRLCRAYRALLADRNPGLPEIVEAYYQADAYEILLSRLPELHARPDGAIFVAEFGGRVAGCGMTHRIDGTTCEIKRVFVEDAARGRGLAQGLFLAAMDQARADGYRRMVLDTMRVLTEAIALYERLGFAPAEPFYDLDARFSGEIQFFGIDL